MTHDLPLDDEELIEILMQRQAHFNGQFGPMIDYYRNNGVGALPHIDIENLENLAAYELEIGEDLAPLFLDEQDFEELAEIKKFYKNLKSLGSDLEKKIGALILSEEEDPLFEREALIAKGKEAVPPLIEILRSEKLHNPLYPGYGQSPVHAALCLGAIGDKRAIFNLFEEISHSDFFAEETMLKAFAKMGQEGKEFLLKVLTSSPIAEDNERAAIALIAFKEEEDVLKTALNLLLQEEVQKAFPFNTYLTLLFDEAKDKELQKAFKEIASKAKEPLKSEMNLVMQSWKP